MQVRYGTLGLLVSAMSALESVLQDCAAAAQAAAGSPAGQQGWLALRRWLQQAARQQLPDPTLLLALLAAAEKEGWETGGRPLPACSGLPQLRLALPASLGYGFPAVSPQSHLSNPQLIIVCRLFVCPALQPTRCS